MPVGPDTEASAASPAVTEQKTVVEQTDLPKAVSGSKPTILTDLSPLDDTKSPGKRIRIRK